MDNLRLHPDTIQEIKQRIDIVEIIGDYVVLKKRGRDHLGLCPFHDEKSPSFSVSPAKQMYYCFGCGAGGNAFNFLMELGKRSFTDVALDLARRYQIQIQTLEPAQKQELQRQLSLREQLYEIMAVAAGFYHHTLFQPQGQEALTYLDQKRCLSSATIQEFQLGYAPAGWETLYRYLVEQKRYPVAAVEQAGLIKARQSGTGYYDQFRHRLMIPIRDVQGKTIAFGSRTLGNDEPKYLNSPETPLFHKSKTLFGLDQAKTAIQKVDEAILVEGYFDVIALHESGIKQTVAALGIALSRDQVQSLMRFSQSKQIIFNFDADKAGINATQRAIQEIEPLVYSGQVNLRILNLPAGKDADEFIHSSAENKEIYQTLVKQAPLWVDWQIQQLLKQKNLKDPLDFEQVARGMVDILKRLTDQNKRAYYLQLCGEILSQGDSRLISLQVNNLSSQLTYGDRPGKNGSRHWQAKDPTSSLLEKAEALLLKIYLHCPQERPTIDQILTENDLLFSFAHHRLLWQKIDQVREYFNLDSDPDNQLPLLVQLAYLEQEGDFNSVESLFQLTETSAEDLFRANLRIPEAIAIMEKVPWESYQKHCFGKLQQLDPRTQAEDFRYYQEQWQKAHQEIQRLESQRLNQPLN
ncbi:DNA primase [Synechocystis sp. PCC 6803]|uniref:DNA primase n=1 Tax=Synechocystis sp. (strain ATCC 27184 / PCC 6803 / Kazusa) TaxID=1111708 RepID=DNAG_SYNY3|nr:MULTISPECIES: DNA primase [unclassified Synechocystis]P74143.1 RecName: Full=DNA primase [Synechocystis sp. PCC 6803 substr. Kazusa]BAM55061.1 DNA primase [Synechocystis sp. PCC 6803] [Bacillus subtilis BEST7613]AGF51917.1 DNA primase [Synechocystis sp. PCC 6803]ALJ67887.1 DNA primase [Synechocystis sp. PCC 6803]AVP89719.1 DNA primase [Synechocystis sp. IPPAS B-1465]MBD2619105.1 DNA primase [Synechocystis sp. FACHB-898]